MREIKFRGRTPDGKWVYGDLITSDTDTIGILEPSAPCLECITDVIPESVGQFTGLHDKNGKEIFEGDIVKWILTMPEWGINGGYKEYEIEEIGEIKWDGGALYLGEYCAGGFAHESEDYAEIIGNIHDNSELLKSL